MVLLSRVYTRSISNLNSFYYYYELVDNLCNVRIDLNNKFNNTYLKYPLKFVSKLIATLRFNCKKKLLLKIIMPFSFLLLVKKVSKFSNFHILYLKNHLFFLVNRRIIF